MLLITKSDYAAFHTVLEGLGMGNGLKEAMPAGNRKTAYGRDPASEAVLEEDEFLKYPLILEQYLMEGAYDKAWAALKTDVVPSKEFAVFSEVIFCLSGIEGARLIKPQMLRNTIRSGIASCSEKSYLFVSISSAKTLLFLDSEGAVVQFAKNRGWTTRDGHIYFHLQQAENVRSEREILQASNRIIEDTIGYARELETII